jgi:hypothetical protein
MGDNSWGAVRREAGNTPIAILGFNVPFWPSPCASVSALAVSIGLTLRK